MIAIIVVSSLFLIGIIVFILWQKNVSLPKLLDKDKTGNLQILETWLEKLYKTGRLAGTFYLRNLSDMNSEVSIVEGYADLSCRLKIDRNSTFRLASLSKSFTAFATTKLCEEYKLPLKSDFGEVINEPLLQGITILDLLQHRSGLTNDYTNISNQTTQKFDNDQIISAYIAKYLNKRIFAQKSFKYLNINYVLLTRLFPVLAKSTYEDYLNNLLTEHGLTQTTTVNKVANNGQLVSSYESFFRGKHLPIRSNSFDKIVGDGGVISNTDDLKKWGEIWKNEILLNDNISKIIVQGCDSPGLNYQFGWVVEKDFFWHNGSWNGFNTFLMIDPQSSRTLIVLDHSNNPRFNSIIKNTLRFLNIKIAAYGT